MQLRLFLASLLVAGAPATAQVRVLASNGVRAVIEQVQPQAERAVGAKLKIEYATSTAMKQRIENGEAFDVTVLTSDLVEQLAKGGKVSSSGQARVARAGIGVGIRMGAPKPDIRTADAFKRAMENAKSVTYAQDGASRAYLEKDFDRMGIGDAMKKKTILESGSAKAAARVASGDAEMILTLQSEILPAPGVELVGPIPAEYQSYISFTAAAGSKTGNTAGSKALVDFLNGPAVKAVLKSKGMEPIP